MTTYIVPPEYVGLRDVQRRAHSVWGNDASGRLKYLLVSGGLTVSRIDQNGDFHLIEADFWKSLNAAGVIKYDEFRSHDQRRPTGRPLFKLEEVDKEVPIKTIAKRPLPNNAAQVKGKGGRPTIYSETDFLIEAAFLLYDGQQFDTPAELRKAALAAYSASIASGQTPTDEWARPLINRLWTKFRPTDRA